jgi:hypothetical protein
MKDEAERMHAVATWQIDVSDDFTIATIKPIAIRFEKADTDEFYDLQPLSLTVGVLRRFHAELEGLLQYMESGGTRHPGTRQ